MTPAGARHASVPEQTLDRLAHAVELREHVGNVRRLRLGVCLGGLIWIAFGFIDWAVTRDAYPASIAQIWMARIAVLPLTAVFLWRMFRNPLPSRRGLVVMEMTLFTAIAASMGYIALLLGGVGSPYTAGMVLVLLCRGAFVVQPWRASLRSNLVIAGAYFATLLLGVWISLPPPPSAAWSIFLLHAMNVTTGVALIVVSGHSVWALRRNAFAMRRVADYDLLRPLAHGGQGDVWHAQHRVSQRDVALKLLTDHVDPKKAIRFAREFEILSGLVHPNIVRVLDYGVSDEQIWYYAMELLSGSTLAELIQDRGPLELSRAAALFVGVSRALSASHACGFVHRDVKPENIFVVTPGRGEEAKLLDYGISRLLAQPPQQLTETSRLLGTPAFMPPEVVSGGQADSRSDVYSTAAAFWYAITGHLPFAGRSLEAMLRAHMEQDRAQLSTGIPGDTGRRVDQLLRACLAIDPTQRPQTADALGLELQAFCRDLAACSLPTPAVDAYAPFQVAE